MTPVEFRGDLWRQKTRVPGLSCGVVCVILRLAVLVEHRLVTDGRTDRRTDGHRAMASTADAQHRAVKNYSMRPSVCLSVRHTRSYPYTQGEVTSQILIWSRYDRYFVGVTRYNASS